MTAINQDFEPIKIDSSAIVDRERMTLFYIDEMEYTVPKKIPPNIVMKYLNDVFNEGADYALSAAFETILGAESMQALADCDSVTDEQMEQIFSLLERMLMSATKKISGKSRRARRR